MITRISIGSIMIYIKDDGTLTITDDANIIELDREATYKLYEMLISNFFKYLTMNWLVEHASSIVPDELFEEYE